MISRKTEIAEDEDVCEFCDGTGEIEITEHVTGSNIIPGGFHEGSGRFRKCRACNTDDGSGD